MALPSDRDGFLLGDPITLDQDAFAKALSILQAIKGDTMAMRRSLASGMELPPAATATPSRTSKAPALTDAQARALGRQISDSIKARQSAAAIGHRRGQDGRFLPTAQSGGAEEDQASGAATASPAPADTAAITVLAGSGLPTAGEVPFTPAPPAPSSVASPARPGSAGALPRFGSNTLSPPASREAPADTTSAEVTLQVLVDAGVPAAGDILVLPAPAATATPERTAKPAAAGAPSDPAIQPSSSVAPTGNSAVTMLAENDLPTVSAPAATPARAAQPDAAGALLRSGSGAPSSPASREMPADTAAVPVLANSGLPTAGEVPFIPAPPAPGSVATPVRAARLNAARATPRSGSADPLSPPSKGAPAATVPARVAIQVLVDGGVPAAGDILLLPAPAATATPERTAKPAAAGAPPDPAIQPSSSVVPTGNSAVTMLAENDLPTVSAPVATPACAAQPHAAGALPRSGSDAPSSPTSRETPAATAAITVQAGSATLAGNRASAVGQMPTPVRRAATPLRDGDGRFLSRAEREGGGREKDGDSHLPGAAERLGKAADSLRATGDAAEAIDPTMTAVREVGEVVTPVLAPMGSLLKTGLRTLFSRGESEEIKQARPWYKRIFKELVELRRNTEGGPAESGRSGMLMPLLTSVAGFATPMLMGLLGAAIPLLLAGAGALLAGGIGWKIGEWINEKWGQQISNAVWNTSEWIKEKWGGTADWLQSKWDGVTATFGEVAGKFGAWLGGLAAWGNEKLDTAKRYASDKASQAPRYVAATASSAKEAATVAGGRLVGALAPGYRHRESFDGIAGGAQMAALGTYTNAEANRIRELRSQGANTSANLKGGMPADVRDKIIAGARASGLDPSTMLRIAAMESGGNPNAVSATGAIGVYQFTGRTASAVGIRNRFDVDENIAGAMDLTKANTKTLQAVGQPVTPENLYLLHQLGPTSGLEVIKGAASGAKVSDLSPAAQRAVKLNYGAGSATAADYLTKNRKALDDRYARVVGGIPSNEIPSTIAAPKAPTPAAVPAVPLIPRSAPLVLASAARPASASIPMPKLTSMAPAPVPAPAPAPAVLTPIGSNARAGNKTTITLRTPISQNLSDRTIAHVATGGLGG